MAKIIKEMIPSWKYVKDFLDIFSKHISVSGLPFDAHDFSLTPKDNTLELEFQTDNIGGVYDYRTNSIGTFVISDGTDAYIVPENKSHISETGLWTSKCKIEIQEINRSFSENKEQYLRYHLPVGSDVVMKEFPFEFYNYEGGSFSQIIHISLTDGEVHIMYLHKDLNNFLIIEPQFQCNLDKLMNISYAIQVAYGFVSGTIYLDNAVVVSAETLDFSQPTGLIYKSLSESVKSQYSILSYNSHYIAEVIADANGIHDQEFVEQESKKWRDTLVPFGIDTFGRLVSHVLPFDKFYRTILILMNSSKAPLEYQAAVYCLALENICGVVQKEKDIKDKKMLEDDKWEIVKDALLKAVDDKIKEHNLETARNFLEVTIKAINKPTNRDKLNNSFVACGYNPNQEELKAIDERNRFLHGHNPQLKIGKNEEDKLMYLSLMIHRLCCTLILKLCGFSGYIKNNVRIMQYMMPSINVTHQEPFMQI